MSHKHYELEPRILLDAAALVTVSDVADSQSDSSVDNASEQVSIEQSETQLSDIEQLVDDLGNLDSSTDESVEQIIFIDSRVIESGYEVEADENTLVVILDSESDGVEQITEVLAQYNSLESIHIISHGGDGELLLGSTTLTTETLSELSEQISSWQDATEEGADLLLYGCNLAESTEGEEFVQLLSSVSGLDVAASVDSTGSDDLGGDWDLEYSVGEITAGAVSLIKTDGTLDDILLATGASDDVDTVSENETITGNVQDNDTTESTETVSYVNDDIGLVGTAVDGSAGGSFTIDSEGNYSFDPGTDFDYLTDGESVETSVSYTLSDGTSATLTITVTGSNDALVVTNNSATLDEESDLDNPTSQTISSDDLQVTDSESDASEITYTLTELPEEGTLTLGGTVLSVGDTFTQEDIDNGLLCYISSGSEASDDSFSFDVTDGDGAVLEDQQLTISLTAYNDALEADSTMTLDDDGNVEVDVSVAEGETITLSSSDLYYTDVDTEASNITYTLTELSVSEGALYLNGVALSAGETFTQADIDADYVTYEHNGDEPSDSQGFSYSVTDGDTILTGSVIISVTPVNDTPDVTITTLTVTEGGSGDFDGVIDSGDPDNTDNQIMYTILSLPENGTLKLNGVEIAVGTLVCASDLSSLTYTHDDGEDSSDSFEISVNDGAGGTVDSVEVTISIEAVNDEVIAGLLDSDTGGIAAGLYVDEGAQNVQISIVTFDNDDDVNDITITINSLPDYGVLYFDENGNGVGDEGEEITAGFSCSADQADLFLYSHDGSDGDDGDPFDTSFQITVTDSGGNTYDSGNADSYTTDINLIIKPVDDDPTLDVNEELTLDIDSSDSDSYSAAITDSYLFTDDVDSDAANIVYTLVSIPEDGYLIVNGVVLGVGGSFSQEDIDNDLVEYEYTGDANSTVTDSFTFTVLDSAYNKVADRAGGLYEETEDGSEELVVSTFSITINNSDTDTEDSGSGGDGSSLSIDENETLDVYEGSTDNTITSEYLSASDDGDVSELVYTLDSTTSYGTLWLDSDKDGELDDGEELEAGESFTQEDIDNDLLHYDSDGSEISEDSFQFDLDDNGDDDAIEDQTFNITILAVDDAPVVATSTLEMDEGEAVTITEDNLSVTDADNDIDRLNPEEIVFTITSLPENGTIYVDGVELKDDDYISFTLQDVIDGLVVFAHDGSEDFFSSFDFTVSDGSISVDGTLNIEATPVNDTPSFGGVSVTLTEGESVTLPALSASDVDGVGDDLGLDEDTLTYSITDLPDYGTLWIDADGDGELDEGEEVATGTDLSGDDLSSLIYIHDGTENYTDSIEITVNDNTGASNEESTGTIALNISPVNDDPVIEVNTGAQLHEGMSITICSEDYADENYTSSSSYDTDVYGILSAEDPDNDTDQNQYRITDSVDNGTLELWVEDNSYDDGGYWQELGVGSVFTQEDLDNGYLQYTADPDYEPEEGVDNDDSFSFTLSDAGNGEEVSDTFYIDILPVDDTPEITLPSDQSTSENTSVSITGLSFDDADVDDNTVEVTLSVDEGVLSLASTDDLIFSEGDGTDDSTMTFTGTLEDVNAVVASLTYTPETDYNGTATVTVTLDDLGNVGEDPDTLTELGLSGDGNTESESAEETFTIEVNPVNETPTISLGDDEVEVDEDTTLNFGLANGNAITFGDSDESEEGWSDDYELTVTLSVENGTLTLATTEGLTFTEGDGTDDTTITITGTLTDLNTAVEGLTYSPDENYDESDTLFITINDNGNFGSGQAITAEDSIAITVNPVDDDPTVNEPTDVSTDEDTSVVFTLAFETVDSDTDDDPLPDTFLITDLPGSGTLYFTDESGDSTGVAVEAGVAFDSDDTAFVDGEPQLIYVPGTDQNDTSLDGSVTFTYQVSDDGGDNYTSATATISIDEVNDTPAITLTDAGNTYEEADDGAGTAVQIVSDASVTDIEIDGNGSEDVTYDGATLTVARDGGSVSEDIYSISTDSGDTVYVNSDNELVVSNTVIGTVDGNGTETLTVTFNNNATQADVQLVIESVTFANTSDEPGDSATIAFTFNDGNSGEQGSGGSLEATATVTVEITETNDAPEASDASLSLLEDPETNSGTQISSLDIFSDSDGDDDSLSGVAITGNMETVSETWQYSTDGTTWTDIPTDLSDTNALVLSADSYIRFVPSEDYNDDVDETTGLTIRVLDSTYSEADFTVLTGVDVSVNGDQTAISAGTATISMSVTAVNDEPSASVAGSYSEITVGEDDGTQTLTDLMTSILAGGETDEGGQTITFEVTDVTKTTSNTDLTAEELFDTLPTFTDATTTEGDTSNTLVYTVSQALAEGETETVTVTVSINDDGGTENGGDDEGESQTFTIIIVGANDIPEPEADTDIATESGGLNNNGASVDPSGNVLDNDDDPDASNTLEVIAVTNSDGTAGAIGTVFAGEYGTLELNSDGSYSYEVDNTNVTVEGLTGSNDTLTDTFTYTVSDGYGGTETATLTITIEGANDTPIANDDTDSGSENETITVDVLVNDTDVDSDDNSDTFTLTSIDSISSEEGSSVGLSMVSIVDNELVLTPGTTFDYLAEGESDTLTIEYTMSDNDGAESTATVTITINGENDIPVTADDTATATEAGGLNNDGDSTDPTGNVLSNDEDLDTNNTYEVTAVINSDGIAGTLGSLLEGEYGTLTLNSDGSYSYVVDNDNETVEGLTGSTDTLTDTFTYTVTDNDGGTQTATLTITIEGANDTPIAKNDTDSGTENDTITVDVLANDTDVDSDDNSATFTLTSIDSISSEEGSSVDLSMVSIVDNELVLIPGTTFDYLAEDESDTLTIEYTMSDNDGAQSTATVTITINGENDIPVTVDDTATATEAGGLNNDGDGTNPTGNVLSNDEDLDSSNTDEVTAITNSDGTVGSLGTSLEGEYGSLTLNSDGSYSYVVDNDNETVDGLTGSTDTLTDTFTYTVTDNDGGTQTATLTITIEGANDTPVANDDTGSGSENDTITVDVLANDTDVDSDDKSTTYTLDSIDSITAQEGSEVDTDEISVSITEGNQLEVDLGDAYDYLNEGDSETLTIEYIMSDNDGAESTATVTITIDGENDNPDTCKDTATATESGGLENSVPGTNASGDVLDNDTDVDNDDSTLAVTAISSSDGTAGIVGSALDGDYGTLTISSEGSYSYVVDNDNETVEGLTGSTDTLTDTFTYTVTDADGGTTEETLAITISGTNDTPIANDDTDSGTENDIITVDVLANDTDVDSDDNSTTYTLDSIDTITAQEGSEVDTDEISVSITEGNQLEVDLGDAYDYLNEGDSETLTIEYTMSDNDGAESTATVTITINGENDNPDTGEDTATATESGGLENAVPGTNATGDVLANDTDVDNDDSTLAVTAISSSDGTAGTVGSAFDGDYGTLTISSEGSYSYAVDNDNETVEGLTGSTDTVTDTFTYTVTDADGGTTEETLAITISGTNDTPIAYDDTDSGSENDTITVDVLANDTDVDSDDNSTTFTLESIDSITAANGSTVDLSMFSIVDNELVLTPGNAFDYLAEDETETLRLTYTMTDNDGAESTATVTITINGENDTPETTGELADQEDVDSNTITEIDASSAFSDTDTSNTLTYSADNLPEGLSIDPDTGVISGTLDASASQGGDNSDGIYSVTITATDDQDETTTAEFTYTVTNPAPTATDNSNSLTEDTDNVSGNILTDDNGNGVDNDPDGDALTVDNSGEQAGSYGTVTINSDGSYTYDLNNNNETVQALVEGETLTDTFTYTVTDSEGGTDTATLTITITGENDIPTTTGELADQEDVDSNAITEIDTSTAFSDADVNDTLTYSADNLPEGLTIDSDTGVISGTLDASASQGGDNSDGIYSVTITATDDQDETTTAEFTYTVTNPAPTATDNSNRLTEDMDNVSGNVLTDNDDDSGTDSDPDGDTLTVENSGEQTGSYGTVTINSDGSYTYDLNNNDETVQALVEGEILTDTFTYTVTDSEGGTDTATLTVTITGENDIPTTTGELADQEDADSNAITDIDTSTAFSDADVNDTLTYSADNLPEGLSIDPDAGIISGTLDASASQGGDNSDGIYSVTITATDDQDKTTTAEFTYTVTNPAPTATDNINSLTEDTDNVSGNVLTEDNGDGVDSDPDGDALTVDNNGEQTGNYGTVTINSDGSYTYDLNNNDETVQALVEGETLTDTFTYTVTDSEGGTDTATLTIAITGENDTPETTGELADQEDVDSNIITEIDTSTAFSDADVNDTLTYSADNLPEGLSIDPDTGVISGTLDASASQGGDNSDGVYSVTITATDDQGETTTADFTYTVTNPAPTATDNSNTISEETESVNGNVLTDDDGDGADSDPDGDALTVDNSGEQTGSYGTVTINSDGSYTYDLNNNNETVQALVEGENLTETFTYTVTDSEGGTDTATLIITITGENDTPTTTGELADQEDVDSNTITEIDTSTAFSDADVNDTLIYSADNLPEGLSIDPDTGIISGTLNNSASQGGDNSDGVYSVTITATDDQGETATADFTYTVTNPAPTATDNSNSLTEDTDNLSGNVLTDDDGDGADSDPDGDALTVDNSGEQTGSYGTVTINSDGSYTYDLNNNNETVQALVEGENLTDTFTYTVTDSEGGTDTATLIITITGENDTPTTTGELADQEDVDSNTITEIDTSTAFSDADVNDTLIYSADNLPEGLSIDPDTGIISGTLNNSASQGGDNSDGVYSVTITATDDQDETTTAEFTYTVTNPAPTATDNSYSLTEDTDNVSGNVLTDDNSDGVDSDSDGDTLTVENSGEQIGSYGTVTINSDGSYTYDLNNNDETVQALVEGETLTDTFTYTVTDSEGGTDTATLTITITGENDTPETTGELADQEDVDSNIITEIDTSTAFSDADVNDTLTYSADNLPEGLSIDPDTGVISGTLNNSASQGGDNSDGVYSVTITATDDQDETTTADFTYTVTNPAPSATDNSNTISEETESVNGNVLTDDDGSSTDNDPDGDALTVENSGEQTGSYGTVTINSDGSYTYNLNNNDETVQALAEGETLTDTFTYTITDSEGGTDTAILTVTITGENDTPETTGELADQEDVDSNTITEIDASSAFSDTDTTNTLTYSASNLPDGLSIDPDTGIISGTLDASASQGGDNSDGVYSVTITATDDLGETATAEFTYTVTNPAPTSTDNSNSLTEDTDSVSGNVLTDDNGDGVDNDPDGDALTVENSGEQTGSYGTVTISSDGSYTYDLNNSDETVQALAEGEILTETFAYTVTDSEGGTDTATLTITITGENDTPITGGELADQEDVDSNIITEIDASTAFSDTDISNTLTYSADNLPEGLSIDPDTGVISGTLDASASQGGDNSDGVYSVTITATDDLGETATADFTYTVTNPAPTSTDNSNSLTEDTDSVSGNVLTDDNGNGVDSDPDGDALTVENSGEQIGSYGTVTISSDGSYTYDLNNSDETVQALVEGETLTETFTYTVTDSEGGTDTATLTITITGENDTPETTGDLADQEDVDSNAITEIDASTAFSDADVNDTLTYSTDNLPEGLSIDPDTGVISGTLDTSASQGGDNSDGVYSVTITATDDQDKTATADFTYTVTNPAPTATDNSNSLTEDTDSVSGNVLTDDNGNGVDSDPDGDALTVENSGEQTGSYGTVIINSDGSYTYDLNNNDETVQALAEGETQTETFTYTVTDREGGTDTATLTITITGENDTPETTGELADQEGADSNAITEIDTSSAFSDTDTSNTLTYSASNLPDGLSIDPDTGVISGTLDASASQGGDNSDGVYSVTITVTDNQGETATADFTYTVTNPAPIATDNSNTISEETESASGNVLTDDNGDGVDSDPDGDALTVENSGELTGSYGTVTINSDGSYIYDLNNSDEAVQALAAGETLTETFTYTVTDSEGGTDTATLTITITGENDTPETTGELADQEDADNNTITEIDTSSAFSDTDTSNTLTYSASNLPGGLSIDPDTGIISGTLDASSSQSGDNSDGVYSVTITATDDQGETATADFTYTVTNPAPTATENSNSLTEDTDNVSGNVLTDDDGDGVDSDPDGDALTVENSGEQTGSYGTVTINSDGSYTYDLNNSDEAVQALVEGETLTETFTYTVTDSEGGTDTATLTITITGENDTPETTGELVDQEDADSNTITDIDTSTAFSDADVNDTLTYSADDLPEGLSIDPDTGIISGTLNNSASQGGVNSDGVYSVTITATDDQDKTATAEFTYTVTNPAPTATDNSNSLTEDTDNASGNVLTDDDGDGVDSDPDGDALTVENSGEQTGSYGTVTINSDGSYTYDLNNSDEAVQALVEGETLTETFTYTVTDSEGGTDTATLTITITGENDMPETTGDLADQEDADSNTIMDIDTSTAFSDADVNDTLTYSADDLPEGLSIDPDIGIISGTLDASSSQGGDNSDGVYSVTITATDDQGETATAEFTYTVTNPAPTATDNSNSLTEDTDNVSGNVLTDDDGDGVDSDPDGDTLTVENSGEQTGSYGTVTINSDGSYTYDLNNSDEAVQALVEGETLTETFTYMVTDSEGGTDTATLTITITGENDTPETTGELADQEDADSNTITDIDTSTAFSDADVNDTLVYSTDNLPEGLSIDPDTGIISGTLDASASQGGDNSDGVYSITITATDDQDETTTAEFTYTVTNPAPTATDNSNSLTEDTNNVSGNVLTDGDGDGVDSDLDGDTLTVENSGEQTGSYGTLTIGSDGNYTYVLDNTNSDVQALTEDESLTETFTYMVTDSEGGADAATLTIAINGLNDVSVIEDDDTETETTDYDSSTEQEGSSESDNVTFISSDTSDTGTDQAQDSNDSDTSLDSLYQSSVSTTNIADLNPVSMRIMLQDQLLGTEGVETFSLPANTFQHENPNEAIVVEVSLPDGAPLPDYIEFDAETGQFELDATKAHEEGENKIVVRVTGHDNDGNSASATFTIILQEEGSAYTEGQKSLASMEGESENFEAETEVQPEETGKQQAELNQDTNSDLVLGLEEQLKIVGADEFALRKEQLLMDIEKLFG